MARIKLAYPKMPGSDQARLDRCIAFEKYDGTNLHWVWEQELGWYAFGTRRQRFDMDASGIADFNAAHPELEEAAEVFERTLRKPLTAVFERHNYFDSNEIVVFTEFIGANSFAGKHKPDDPKRLILFDVFFSGGFLAPEEFVANFGGLPSAKVIFKGKLTGKFIHDVRVGKWNVQEGVVCKGGRTGDVWMVKIKTDAYQARLKRAFADKWEDHWE